MGAEALHAGALESEAWGTHHNFERVHVRSLAVVDAATLAFCQAVLGRWAGDAALEADRVGILGRATAGVLLGGANSAGKRRARPTFEMFRDKAVLVYLLSCVEAFR